MAVRGQAEMGAEVGAEVDEESREFAIDMFTTALRMAAENVDDEDLSLAYLKVARDWFRKVVASVEAGFVGAGHGQA